MEKKLYEERLENMTVSYYLTKGTVELEGAVHTRFGVAVETSLGEREEVFDLCAGEEDAVGFIGRLAAGLVTPVTLRDVAYDFVAEI